MTEAAWDVRDKVCLVTGANTGIGKVTARELAARGAHVILACRSEDKTRAAIDEIVAATGNDRVEFHALDLSNLAKVRASAEAFKARGLPLHVLVANAGLAGQRGTTDDGFELAFGVNHMGHFLFVNLLVDVLEASAPARVVVVASKAHYSAKGIDFDAVRGKTKSVTGLSEYEVSKLANVLFTSTLAKQLEGTGVTTYSLHPGVIASDVWRRIPWPIRPIMTSFMKSTEEGAQTSVYCATAPELAGESGQYYDECRARTPSAPARDEELAAELWKRSEAWCELGT